MNRADEPDPSSQCVVCAAQAVGDPSTNQQGDLTLTYTDRASIAKLTPEEIRKMVLAYAKRTKMKIGHVRHAQGMLHAAAAGTSGEIRKRWEVFCPSSLFSEFPDFQRQAILAADALLEADRHENGIDLYLFPFAEYQTFRSSTIAHGECGYSVGWHRNGDDWSVSNVDMHWIH